MFEGLNHIELSGKTYPIKCDLLVLEKIQEEYGDLSDFENKLSGFAPAQNEDGTPKRNEEGYIVGTYGMPNIKVVNQALCWMVQEGMEIEAEENGDKVKKMSDKTILRSVDMRPEELGRLLQKEFAHCFERKNAETT